MDEVGRGPLAGPVTVCAFAVSTLDVDIIPRGLKNSKALSAKAREKYAREFRKLAKEGKVVYKISSVSETIIDKKGIVFSVHLAIARALRKLKLHSNDRSPGDLSFEWKKVLVLLDGGIRAPKEYLNQKTIIKGDIKEPIIAAASIVAKVFRDKKMIRLALRYPEYGFERHKGYGTRAHYKALKKHGPSPIHRLSFLT